MPRRIKNPFIRNEEYHCFGCRPDHPTGLRMEFIEEEDKVLCRWQPRNEFQGYLNILHGGIQATLADEIASWFIFVKLQTAGVTSRLEMEYRKPVRTDQGKLMLEAELIQKNEKTADVQVTLYTASGEIGSVARVTYYIYPARVAERKLNYPGLEAFFDHEK